MSVNPYFVVDAGCQVQPVETRDDSLYQIQGGRLRYVGSAGGNIAPPPVTPYDSISYPPVFAGITLIAGDISTMPWQTKRSGEGGIMDATDHPTRKLLLRRPDPGDEPTANIFVETLLSRALFYGLAGAKIYRGGPLHHPTRIELVPHRIRPVKRRGDRGTQVFYEWTNENGEEKSATADEMLILRGPTIDGTDGMGLFEYARRVVSRALAAGRYNDEFFSGGAVPRG